MTVWKISDATAHCVWIDPKEAKPIRDHFPIDVIKIYEKPV